MAASRLRLLHLLALISGAGVMCLLAALNPDSAVLLADVSITNVTAVNGTHVQSTFVPVHCALNQALPDSNCSASTIDISKSMANTSWGARFAFIQVDLTILLRTLQRTMSLAMTRIVKIPGMPLLR